MKNLTQKFIGLLALVFVMSFTINAQEIGDIYEGGYIFQINEDGTGLVADLQDLGLMNWDDAMDTADVSTSQGYDDWYLPSKEELELIYNTIGTSSDDNIGGFDYSWYWSSSEYSSNYAWFVSFGNGGYDSYDKTNAFNVRVIRSVAFGEDENTEEETADNYLDLPEGWSMFGYTCIDSVDAMVGFSEISDKIEIVKDEWGLSYLPSWEFNAMGSLQFSEGYQIKMIEEVTDFQFCEAIVPEDGITQADLDAANSSLADALANLADLESQLETAMSNQEDGIGQADVDAAYAEGAASVTPEDGITQADLDALAESYAGWCASDIDNDGICDADEVSGCMDASSCNYVAVAEFDDSSCEYTSCLDECGVINGDNSSCTDCAGVLNGASEDLGCGCNNPAPIDGYDCDGNFIIEIGDQHAGGIVFQIKEDGTGLVADLQDLGQWEWYAAMAAAENSTSQGYDDWYLPSIEELELMYSTIGNGGPEGNIGNFQETWYWSSSEYNNFYAWIVNFSNGYTDYNYKYGTSRVRVIRAF